MERLFSAVDKRRLEPEEMDRPGLDAHAHDAALEGLRRINALSLTARHFLRHLKALHSTQPQRPLRVLDIACGGGDVVRSLAMLAARRSLPIEIDGCDLSLHAIRHASEQARRRWVQAGFFRCNALNQMPEGYDVLTSSLFLHHLHYDEAVSLLRRMADSARQMILVSDLLRTRRGMALAALTPKLLTASTVVHEDAVRSARAAFSYAEISTLARDAGLDTAVIHRTWPMRFLLVWRRQ